MAVLEFVNWPDGSGWTYEKQWTYERWQLETLLELCGSYKEVARRLKVSPTCIRYRAKKYNINFKQKRRRNEKG